MSCAAKTFLALLFSICLPAWAETIQGKVVAVLDGDTVTLLDWNRQQHRIRLAQIDAPEVGHGRNQPGQPFGQASRRSLSELTFGREVLADCQTQDKYGRQVCTLWAGRNDLNLEQVRRGMAWVFRKYATDPAYYQAEQEAKTNQRGLWSQPGAIPPWEWRH